MAQGDPRYVGYASAAIGPLAQSATGDARYWLVRGLIQQYSHDFAGALQSLEKASELDPQSPEPIAWRAAIHMVQARYREALSECTQLVPLAHPLHAQGCTAYVLASTGHLAPAYESLRQGVGRRRCRRAGTGAVGADPPGRDGDTAAALRRGRGALQGSVSPGRDRPVPAGRLCGFPAAAKTPGRSGEPAGGLGAFRHPAVAAGAGRACPERSAGRGLGRPVARSLCSGCAARRPAARAGSGALRARHRGQAGPGGGAGACATTRCRKSRATPKS